MAATDPGQVSGRGELLRRMIEENGRVDERLFAPNAVSFRPWDLVAQTLAGVDNSSESPRAADTEAEFSLGRMFANVSMSIEAVEEIGSDVRIWWRMHGTHANEFLGIQPTGAEINATGHTTYRFDQDRIVEVWGAADCSSLGMMCSQIVEAMARTERFQPLCAVGDRGSNRPGR